MDIDRLNRAAQMRASRSAREDAVARELERQGCGGDFIREGDRTIYAVDGGTVILEGTSVRRANSSKAPVLTEAALKNAVKDKRTEDGQVNALIRVLGEHGIRKAPKVQETSEKGRTVRVYSWETPIGLVALLTGPAWKPKIQVIDDDKDWQDAPDGAYVPADDWDRPKRAQAQTQRVLEGFDRPARPAPAPRARPAPAAARAAPARKPRAPRTARPRPAPPPVVEAVEVEMPQDEPAMSQNDLLALLKQAMASVPVT